MVSDSNQISSHIRIYKELVSDSCVLKHKNEKCYILLFVDDLIILTKNEQLRKDIESDLNEKFRLKILGKLKVFVGYEIDYNDNGDIHVHQTDYAVKIVDTFKSFLPS